MHQVCCSVCGSCNCKFYLEEDKFTVVTCKECGHLYTLSIPDVSVVAANYAVSGDWIKAKNDEHSGSDKRFQQYAEALSMIFYDRVHQTKVIDIGCSKGRFLHLLQQRGFDCWGVELGHDAAIASQLLGAARIIHAAYTEPLPIAADVVTMFEVLEHIPEPHQMALMVFHQLRNGGYFMGSVPNGTFIRAKVWLRRVLHLRSFIVPLRIGAGKHINLFSPRGIQVMLERLGFEFLWCRNAPLDFNYTANRFSPLLKSVWWLLVQFPASFTGNLLGSNIFFLARKPSVSSTIRCRIEP